MGLLKEQTSFSAASGRQSSSNHPSSPEMLGTYYPGKQRGFSCFVLLPARSPSCFVPNEHFGFLSAISQ